MKQIIKYCTISIVILLASGCNDWLELIPPDGLIREEYYQSKQDVVAVLMAGYERFASMDERLFLYGEIRADMLRGDVNQPNAEELIMEGNITPENYLCDWSLFYVIINFANEVIKNAPEVQVIDNTFSDFERRSIEAEAYFLRSLSYFYLVRVFGGVPLVLEPTETDDSENIYISQSTEKEVLDQIVKDLEENLPYAPSGSFISERENRGRASKEAYLALLADIALWRFDYEAVIEYVEQLEQSELIELMPGGKWFEIFYPGNSLEGIFEFQFDGNLDQNNSMFSMTDRYSFRYDPSQAALNMLHSEFGSEEIVRGAGASLVKLDENDYVIWKYIGSLPDGQSLRSGNERLSCNFIVYRMADVLLMKAEALSQISRYSEASDILNLIRNRAGLQPLLLANTPIAFEDAILDERSRELAFEGKRWFDLMRMGRRNEYARKKELIEIIISNVIPTQKRILGARLTNPNGWYLPVFKDEIERNKELVQNPFYIF